MDKRLTSAKQRCENPRSPGYANYGGRGIKFDFPTVVDAGLYLLDRLGWANAFTLNLLFGLGLATRLLVHRWGLGLPGFQNHGHGTDSNIPD